MTTVRAAVVQAGSVVFDRDRTLSKLEDLAADAAAQGAQLAVFPEAFVGGYPRGITFGSVVGDRTAEGRDHFRRYWESAVDVAGPDVDRLARLARATNLHLVAGVVERDGGTLYCTVLFLSPDGYLGKHRKRPRTGGRRGCRPSATSLAKVAASCSRAASSLAAAISLRTCLTRWRTTRTTW